MRYALSCYNREQTNLIRDIYIAEAVRQLGRGCTIGVSLSELLGLDKGKEDRTAEEIIDDVIGRLEA